MRTSEATEYCLVFLKLRFFSSMLPSMPKGEIFSMNDDVIPLGEYPKNWRALTCCIHEYICH